MAVNYTFVVQTDKNQEAKSDVMKIYEVPFEFYRFRLLYTDHKKGQAPFPATKVPLFDYYIDGFNKEGYLYIIYEKYRGRELAHPKWIEYNIHVSESYLVTYNLLDKGTRKPVESQKNEPYINFTSGDIAWVAYSEQQWDLNYLEKIISDKEALKKRFQKLDVALYTKKCEEFNEKKETKYAVEEDPDNDGYDLFYSYSLHESEVNLSEEPTKEKSLTPFIYSFPLHDPMGAADDIIDAIRQKMEEYRDLLASFLLPTNNAPSAKDYKDFEALYESALLLHNLFYSSAAYSNPDLKKYRDKIDPYKINGVLGGNEKRDIANQIRGYLHIGQLIREKGYRDGLRDALGTLLFSNYYQSVIVEIVSSENDKIKSEATARRAFHLECIFTDPDQIDGLTNISAQVPENRWKEKVAASLPHNNKDIIADIKYVTNDEPYQNVVKELFRQNIVLETSSDFSTMYSMALSFQSLIGLHVQCFTNLITTQAGQIIELTAETTWLNTKMEESIKRYGRFENQNTTYDKFVKSQGKDFYYAPQRPVNKDVLGQAKEAVVSYTQMAEDTHNRLENAKVTYKEFEANQKGGNAILKNPAFNMILFGLSALNMINVGYQLVNYYGADDREKNMEAWELWSYTFASTVQIGSAWFGLNRNAALDRLLARKIAEYLDGQLSRMRLLRGQSIFTRMVGRGMTLSTALGLLAGMTFSYISIRKGYFQYNENNRNASVANIVAGIACGLNVILTLVAINTMAFATALAVTNIVLFVIAILAAFIAAYITNDYIESFLECTVFSRNGKDISIFHHFYYSSEMRDYLFRYRSKLTEPYNRTELNSYKRSMPMSDFQNMFEWLVNLVTDFQGRCKLRKQGSCTFNNITYKYPYFAQWNLRFRYFAPQCLLETHLVIYPRGLDYYNETIVVAPDTYMNYTSRDEKGFYTYENIFRIGSMLDRLVRRQHETTDTVLNVNSCCYILFARIINQGTAQYHMNFPYLPENENPENRYIAFYETLFTTGTSYVEISRYDGQYRAGSKDGKTHYTVDDKEVLIGTKQEIYNQIKPLRIN